MNWDLFWPRLNTGGSLNQNELRAKDLDKIRNLALQGKRTSIGHCSKSTNLLLDEARRLYDHELGRKTTADNKAGIYIATVTALFSLLASVTPIIFKEATASATVTLSVLCMIVGLLNLMRAALWAQKVLQVNAFHLLGWQDLIQCSKSKDAPLKLTKEILTALRINYDLTNEKVTYIKMTHTLMISASFWLILLLGIQLTGFTLPHLLMIYENFNFCDLVDKILTFANTHSI
ncbi:hypothetical protein L1285_15990 [Pseudoalteromonas sp. DL2-H2.2]|uniref:hypothetical protein n=1 Tax=Pseudoalteromonas sp. DL2-H2.2 TaxID=2908889 RepID=UPI001F1D5DFF|nr:hypothetical protein [Pseudoalteromonas sp. DL2-H2.2]MCF2909827.1 hypothetical protein [Pseudoalteromonas sp. DL2-H2.2]